jgi:phytoene/squalene synthetase
LAKSGIRQLPGRSKLAVYVAYIYYLALLRKIERSPEQLILSKRIRINNFHKSALLSWALLRYHLKLL